MKLKTCVIIVAAVACLLPAAVSAQTKVDPVEMEMMAKQYADSYDSLLNNYYMRRYAHHRLRHQREYSAEEFDALPDSVIAQRLQALRTVVPMTYNNVVRQYIKFYLRHMSTRMDVMLTLCEYYHPLFEEVLNRYGVPDELKYLTIVESAMNPMLTSRAGAAGLWQFMYSTGKIYDLEVNSIVDERRDPYKSTVAAARYLADLYHVFGDWHLAIAAYNCGPGNINKAIARSGGKRDFWQIYPYLPKETRGYIPSLIAATYVMNYYDAHGLHPNKINLPIRSDTVMLHHDVLLCYVSDRLDIDMSELQTLNPQYRRGLIPASTESYSLTLPTAKIERFIALQDTIVALSTDSLSRRPVKVEVEQKAPTPTSSGSGRYHVVKKGETLTKIAAKYGISVATLKKRNGIKGDTIRVGQRLKIR